MNLIDEEEGPLPEPGEEGDQLMGLPDVPPDGLLDARAELLREEAAEARLPESRRTVEERVPEGLAPLAGRPPRQEEVLDRRPLADEFAEARGPEARGRGRRLGSLRRIFPRRTDPLGVEEELAVPRAPLDRALERAPLRRGHLGRQVIEDYPDGRTYMKVVGVVGNFHFTSLRNEIRPMNFFLSTALNRVVSVRNGSGDLREAVEYIETAWKRLYPGLPLESFFLDTVFDRYYRSENRQRELFGVLSLLAVFIASLGLFGLTANAAERRTKEIGIRKALGASTMGIVRLLSWEFTRWVLVANLLAWPAAYLFLSRWLHGFAYRIELPAQGKWFVFAAALSLVIAWLTVGAQAVRAAAANPVRSLRYE